MPKLFKDMTLAEISELVYANNCVKGFNDEPDVDKWIATQMANLHGEVSELWDAYRAGAERELCDKAEKMVALGFNDPLNKEQEEVADIIIRALGFARHRGIDISRAIFMKHSYNVTRPHMHGKKS